MQKAQPKSNVTDSTQDRTSVRRGRIFRTFDEVDYVQNLVQQTADHQKKEKIMQQPTSLDYEYQDLEDSTLLNTDVQ